MCLSYKDARFFTDIFKLKFALRMQKIRFINLLHKLPFILLVIQISIFAFLSLRNANESLYASPLSLILWISIILSGIWVIFKYGKRPSLWLFHLSFVLILIGALATHISGERGRVMLRTGETTRGCILEDGNVQAFPFEITLLDFQIKHYDGTDVPADYTSVLIVDHKNKTDNQTDTVSISMNNIYKSDGFRFYQTSFDPDMQGSTLTVSYDPWGVPLTYTGYLVLLISMIWILLDKNSGFRKLLNNTILKQTCFILILSCITISKSEAKELQTFDRETADEFGKILIQHQNRITTMETYANDFLRKISGKRSYKGYTATQVLCGWILAPQQWQEEPMIKVKSDLVRQKLGIGKKARLIDFFDDNRQYKLMSPEIGLSTQNFYDKKMKDWAQMDEKIEIIVALHAGDVIRVFPFKGSDNVDGNIRLLSPNEMKDKILTKEDSLLTNCFFPLLYENFQRGDDCKKWIQHFRKYQIERLGKNAPSPAKLKAEQIYNHVYAIPICSYITISVGLIAFILTCLELIQKIKRVPTIPIYGYIALVWLYLTTILVLRTIISNRLPLSNGYETLLLISWLSQGISLLLSKKMPKIYLPGLLLSGFALLGASISDMDPQITPLMPVLNSPLLTAHVSLMMISYTLAGFITLVALLSISLHFATKISKTEEKLVLMNRILLYPTVFCMATGIFIGAVWANVSWGSYWSWDPKETWALISMIVYGLAFHSQSIRFFQKPLYFQLYLLFSILCLLITYFGVNYYLGGMHSYANS